MNIQGFFEVVILRDILAFILPGSISLAGIYMIMYSSGVERLERVLPFLSNLDSTSRITLFLLISFLAGHVWDMIYRKRFQTHPGFQRKEKFKEILVGKATTDLKSVSNHIPNQICSSVGQFLHIDWEKTPITEWIESGKAHDLSVLLSYWIEEEDPKIYSDEVARPNIQSHFLHVCGMAFQLFGACALIGEIIRLHRSGWVFEWISLLIGISLIITSFWLGKALIAQGQHKRDILVEHVFRVFHVIWQKRVLAHEANLEIARHGGSLKKKN
jgi:hypothetical protein